MQLEELYQKALNFEFLSIEEGMFLYEHAPLTELMYVADELPIVSSVIFTAYPDMQKRTSPICQHTEKKLQKHCNGAVINYYYKVVIIRN